MLANKLRAATAGAEGLPIEDLFSTYLYKGNGSTQTITNGIDLAGEGGLVWIKHRTNTQDHTLYDTERGVDKYLGTASNAAEATDTNSFSEFLSDGFTVASGRTNGSSIPFVSWTFRKAPKFFDVVTYTGTGSPTTISHNLGSTPGMIIVKRTSGSEAGGIAGWWVCYHRGLSTPESGAVFLNSTDGRNIAGVWNNTAPTSTEFTVNNNYVNYSGDEYVAYLFAHNDGDGEFGPNGDQDIIKCGSYTGNGSTDGPEIDLGWEPQWVMIKRADNTGNWILMDTMRGIPLAPGRNVLLADTTGPESSYQNIWGINLTPTGFKPNTINTGINASGGNYVYLAIRRGPMRAPTSGTEVFDVHYKSGYTFPTTVDTGFVTDAVFHSGTTSAVKGLNSRLTTLSMPTYSATSESSFGTVIFDYSSAQDGFTKSVSTGGSGNQLYYSFRRAPGFFDVVAYMGNSTVGRAERHNLGVAPEMMIVKCRDVNGPDWAIYYGDPTDYLKFTNVATADAADYWNDTAPTESVFTLGNKTDVNSNGRVYIAYLFASLDGVSKVGSYTGNGSSQTINCGFTSGARFVLIKRTDSTGDWYVWDTARGIVTGNDPHLSLGDTSAQVTTDDSIDPDSSGFIVNQVAATNINVSSASYIYLAIS